MIWGKWDVRWIHCAHGSTDHIGVEKNPEERSIRVWKKINTFWNEEGKRKHLEPWHFPGSCPMGTQDDEKLECKTNKQKKEVLSCGIKIPECSRKCQMWDQIGPASNENCSHMDKVASHMAGTAHGRSNAHSVAFLQWAPYHRIAQGTPNQQPWETDKCCWGKKRSLRIQKLYVSSFSAYRIQTNRSPLFLSANIYFSWR